MGASFPYVPDNVRYILLGSQHGLSYSKDVFVLAGVVYRLLHSKPGGEENGDEEQHVDRNHNAAKSEAVVPSHGVHCYQQR